MSNYKLHWQIRLIWLARLTFFTKLTLLGKFSPKIWKWREMKTISSKIPDGHSVQRPTSKNNMVPPRNMLDSPQNKLCSPITLVDTTILKICKLIKQLNFKIFLGRSPSCNSLALSTQDLLGGNIHNYVICGKMLEKEIGRKG